MRAGSILLPAGRRLAAQDVALAAAVGLQQLAVRRRVRVAVFSTGDEIVEPGSPRPGPALFALPRDWPRCRGKSPPIFRIGQNRTSRAGVLSAKIVQLTDDCFAFSGPLLPVDEAERIIDERITPVPETEIVPLRAAAGRILAADLIAPMDLPPFDNAAVDGYAVRHADLDGLKRPPILVSLQLGKLIGHLHCPHRTV